MVYDIVLPTLIHLGMEVSVLSWGYPTYHMLSCSRHAWPRRLVLKSPRWRLGIPLDLRNLQILQAAIKLARLYWILQAWTLRILPCPKHVITASMASDASTYVSANKLDDPCTIQYDWWLVPQIRAYWYPISTLCDNQSSCFCVMTTPLDADHRSYVLRIGGKVQSWTKFHSWSWWSPSFLGSIGHSHFLGGCCSKLPFGWFESILLKNVGWFNSPIFLIFPRTSLFLVGKYFFLWVTPPCFGFFRLHLEVRNVAIRLWHVLYRTCNCCGSCVKTDLEVGPPQWCLLVYKPHGYYSYKYHKP